MSKLGHEQPINDNRRQEGTLFVPYAEDTQGTSVNMPPAEETTPRIVPVDEIVAEHESRVAARAKMFEELTDMNWLPGRIEEKLDKEFPDLRTPEEIERRELATDAGARARSRSEHESRNNRAPTRFVSPRDTGPPPHEAKKIRKIQGFSD